MEDKPRELIQVNLQLHKDQLAKLDRIWKLRDLNSRSELFRAMADELIEENKDLVKDIK